MTPNRYTQGNAVESDIIPMFVRMGITAYNRKPHEYKTKINKSENFTPVGKYGINWNFENDILEDYPNGVISQGNNYYKGIYYKKDENVPRNKLNNTEFIIKTRKFNIRLESKWQQSAGSVAEKFPYIYHNFINDRYPEPICILLYGGTDEKFLKGAKWIKDEYSKWNEFARSKDFNKKLMIFNMDELRAWVNDNL